MARREHRLKIEGFTPETLPMERLAEYMAPFARLLGEAQHVHFVRLDPGSVAIVARADPEAERVIEKRLLGLRTGQADPVARKAYRELDTLLRADHAVGKLLSDKRGVVIEFPGASQPAPLEFGAFREDASIEGVVIRVGGKGDKVPVWLKDGKVVHMCRASVAMSKKLIKHYQRSLLRVQGTGRWLRQTDGAWKMLGFDIRDFEVLDSTPLADVVKQLQSVEGADWGEDPVKELLRLRNGESLN